MENTWEFDTTVGAGSEIVTVVYEYSSDEDGTYNESIKEIWYQNRSVNVIGLLSDEAFKELDIAVMDTLTKSEPIPCTKILT